MSNSRGTGLLKPGNKLTRHYQVVDFIGRGWEGEVYSVQDIETGIVRAAKLFYEHRCKGKTKPHVEYAKKLHRLRECGIVIQYHHQLSTNIKGKKVDFLVSEFVDGEALSVYLKKHAAKRILPYESLHLFYALVKGVAQIHRKGEYHGDIHSDNIIIKKRGIGFEISFIDFIHLGKSTSHKIQDDVYDLITLFYEMIGGVKYYSKMPKQIKNIIMGKRRALIREKFKTAIDLKRHLEILNWEHG